MESRTLSSVIDTNNKITSPIKSILNSRKREKERIGITTMQENMINYQRLSPRKRKELLLS